MRVARLCARLAVVALVIAASQPSIQAAPRERVGILELVDGRSGSTLASDLAPTRLDAIRQATLGLLDRVPDGERVGLVAFSDEGRTLVHPTTDRDAVRAGLASLWPNGGTAIGDALQRALGDIQAARSAAPAAVLLLSDGSNSTGSDALDTARVAAARHVPVFAVAVGAPDGFLTRPDLHGPRQPVAPDPALLAAIAGATGGRAVEARSTPALRAALYDLGRDAGVPGEPRELALLFTAAALLLLAVGSVLSPWRRAASGARAGSLAAVRRLAPTVALLVAAGGAAVAWTQWSPPAGPPPAHAAPTAAPAAPARPPPPPAFATITAASGSDRTMVQRAIAVLRRHRELADQRRAEANRHRLNRIEELLVSACDVCKAEPLTGTSTIGVPTGGGVSCSLNLNTSALRKVAQRADVPAASLAAMLIHYEQELCLQGPVSSRSPFAAGLRLARKPRDGRLFDLLYAQIDARGHDWRTVEQGVALLRGHGELGAQRWEELRRRRLNQVGRLQVQVCRGCLPDLLGDARTAPAATGAVGCDIRVDLAVVEGAARDWGLPVTQVVATLLTHEQEHCIRHPDDRETPAIDAERRLARKLGGGGLLEYVTSRYRELDRSGHWKQ